MVVISYFEHSYGFIVPDAIEDLRFVVQVIVKIVYIKQPKRVKASVRDNSKISLQDIGD